MKHIKSAVLLLLSGLLFLLPAVTPLQTAASEEAVQLRSYTLASFGSVNDEGYAQAGENTTHRLFVHTVNGHFYLENKTDGTRITDIPAGAAEDAWAQGVYRMEVLSDLILNVFDLQSSTTVKKNSETACVRTGKLTVQAINKGFRCVYTFADVGIVLPVVVQLEADYLNVWIDTAVIEQQDPRYVLGSVSLFPYFAAGGPEDEGYILIPDGNGALIHFHNGRTTVDYYEPVYGRDQTYNLLVEPAQKDKIQLPLFGIQHGNQTILAVITGGDTGSILHAVPGYLNTTYTQGYNEFVLHSDDSFVLGEDSITAQTVKLYQTAAVEMDICEQRYYLLTGSESGYAGMAARYRRYLQEEQQVQPAPSGTMPLLDFYCAVQRREPVLGIPLTVTKTLSTAQDITAFLQQLQQEGTTGYDLRLISWSKDELKGRPEGTLSPLRAFGSRKELLALSQTVQDNGGTLYLSAEINRFYRNGSGISSYFDGAKSFSNAPAYQYSFLLSTHLRDKTAQRWQLVRPDKLTLAQTKLENAIERTGLTNLSPRNLANCNYGSYGNLLYSRQDTKQAIVQVLSGLREKSALLLDTPFAYAFAYANALADMPMDSSGYDCMDTEVPFVSMVLSGLRTCFTKPINLEADPEKAILQAAETGMLPHYALITGDSTYLIDTTLNTLTSADASLWKESILAAQQRLAPVWRATAGAVFCEHETLSAGVAMSVYSNGTRILVNYTAEPFDSPYGTVEAGGILVKGA